MSTAEKPVALKVLLDNIPLELTRRDQWVTWKDWSKAPYIAGTDRKAKSDDRSTWRSFEQAKAAYLQGTCIGIGYMFSGDDDDFVGIDLDHCRDDGKFIPWSDDQRSCNRWKAEAPDPLVIIERLGSYSEVSPSGTGVKIFVKGSLAKCGKAGDFEAYDRGRYFTVTGHTIIESGIGINDCNGAIDDLVGAFLGKAAPKKEKGRAAALLSTGAPDADGVIIAKMTQAQNGAAVETLWFGKWKGKYPSQSEADAALCSHLAFWCGPHADRIDRIFRGSGLYRDKWDRDDYRERTIAGAIEGTREFYKWNGKDQSSNVTLKNDAPYHLTDMGNAQRLVRLHGRDLRYCYHWKRWLIWNDTRWEPDESGEIVRRAKITVAKIYDELSGLDKDERKAMARHAMSSEKRERIGAMIALAESEPGIPIATDKLDKNPWLLNVENGTLDLRTGELRQHQRDDYLTKLAPVRYDPDADCPTWLRFIDSTFDGNQSLAEFVRRLFGYCLTGSTRDHILAFLYGTGANGKSVLLNTTIDVMGPDYAMKAPADFLMIKRGEAHPTERADLFGKRLVAAIEAEEGKRLAESMVKELTGGDKVRARRMREDFWEFDATHKVMLAANHKPTIRGQDPGIWRRILLIPFAVRFWDASRGESGPPELEADKELPEKLLAEKSGILNWLLLGCIDWQAKGLAAPKEVLIETDNYRNEQDVVGRFVDERCLESEEAEATAKDLYASFQEWAKQTGGVPAESAPVRCEAHRARI
ncbi:MAG: hypothetical protein IID44_04950 [Planctomycetes bacterium]|nr:hypothetical protein [Planctomycetota bacterium]